MGFGYWTEKHVEEQRQLNLRSLIEKAARRRREAEGHARPTWRPSCATRWWPTTTRTMRRRERRSSTPIRCSCAATISWACRDRTTPGTPPRLFGTGWPSNGGGRLVGSLSGAALRAGRSRAELPGSLADAGADLGRPGAADDSQRQDPALVERQPHADALGGAAHALRPRICWPRRRSMRELRQQVLDALGMQAAPARTVQVGGCWNRATCKRRWKVSRRRSCS